MSARTPCSLVVSVVATAWIFSPSFARGEDDMPAPSSEKPIEKEKTIEEHQPKKPEVFQWGKGLFEIADPYPLADLRAAPHARSPRTLKPLEFELGVKTLWENSN